ncbi:pilus assembly protein PilP [Alginatibacterium sediminis]|uniref:Pilus assembly protein PilP n=1 Tax=Alginatibacterium sediminis TaxID=2164068 RepID=A0A420EL64_9ALTE|nr:type 4a pilus biogenesis protein PilO [Alginatibacterium sediminis]RKF21346.1 pilus assembly protein PilP [Alginatibacterium sediminis]
MNLQELNELDFEDIAGWPPLAKVVFGFVVCGLIVAGMYYFVLKDEQLELDKLHKQEVELRAQFEGKAGLAGNLEAYQLQVDEMDKAFSTLLGQLPSQHEIAGLLDELSFIGVKNGLVFRRINWEREVNKDFSTELPISLLVEGSYDELGKFVSDIAALPRIVILGKVKLSRKNGDESVLVMSVTAHTYRYNGE